MAIGVIRNPIVLSALFLLEWCSYRSADRLVGLSPGMVAGIRKRGVPDARIALVPNGCDLDIFTADADPWRPKGITDTDVLALFSGTHGIANGLDAVLDAAAELRRRHRDDIKRSEEHTSELQSLMRISYAVFCLQKKTKKKNI